MSSNPFPSVIEFLRVHHDPSRPLLLGFSGGPDSLCLLHHLLNYRIKRPFELHLVHVDHGWRKESQEEASQLKKMAEELDLPFHCRSIKMAQTTNLEEISRQERLKFFAEIYSQRPFQALLLAHHADDQAETVLKRLLEGSRLSSLSSIKTSSTLLGMPIWRPLLKQTKKEINHWLQESSLQGLDDYTNRDPRFLRSRMRSSLLPHLAKNFGKEVSRSLCRIAREAQELKEYLDGVIAVYLDSLILSPFGKMFDGNKAPTLAPIHFKHLLRTLLSEEEEVLSYDALNQVTEHFFQNQANKQVVFGKNRIYIDRRRVFITHCFSCEHPGSMPILPGNFSYGPWSVYVREVTHDSAAENEGWLGIWKGKASLFVPPGKLFLGQAQNHSSMSKRWSSHQVPAFLRSWAPVLWENQRISYEFLTTTQMKSPSVGWEITLHLNNASLG